jgi:AcrR family transcriptional regulator
VAEPPIADTRSRLLRAALTCIERQGLTGTTLEDVAAQAGLSRATVYRHFPGGRDQLISETVTWEVGRFLSRLGAAVDAEPDLAGHLRVGLIVGHRAIHEHALLQQVLRTEPEAILRELAEAGPLMAGVVRTYVRGLLDAEEVRAGVDLDEAADYVSRMFLSYLGTPGRWDLEDPQQVDRLVGTQLLAGVLAG